YVRRLGVQSDEAAALWGGVLISVAPLLAGLLAPVWGRLGDRYGQKSMAVRVLGSYVGILAPSGFVTRVWQLPPLRTPVGPWGGSSRCAPRSACSAAWAPSAWPWSRRSPLASTPDARWAASSRRRSSPPRSAP